MNSCKTCLDYKETFKGKALELKDLKANSVRIVNMDKVKIADLTFLSKNSPIFYKWEMNC